MFFRGGRPPISVFLRPLLIAFFNHFDFVSFRVPPPQCFSAWNPNSGVQNSNLATARRHFGPRSSRFQLSAYFCTLLLVRWVPALKSFNVIDFLLWGCFRVPAGRGRGGPGALEHHNPCRRRKNTVGGITTLFYTPKSTPIFDLPTKT